MFRPTTLGTKRIRTTDVVASTAFGRLVVRRENDDVVYIHNLHKTRSFRFTDKKGRPRKTAQAIVYKFMIPQFEKEVNERSR
jgi:hypothetical protein